MKIALIAMNGIRTCDETLLQLGFSLPGFIQRGRAIASLPSLALLTLAGMTPADVELDYIEVPDLRFFEPILDGYDAVAISSYSAQILDAYELADRYREKEIPVIIGGPHVSYLPEEAAEHCDAVAIGEGEAIWSDIIEDLKLGQLKQSYGSIFSNFDMKDAPMPAFELLEPSKYNRLTVQTSRGCPHRCEFCAASILLSKKYKQKPKEKVLAEIDKIKSIWRRPFIEFADDNSLVDTNYWLDLLPPLKKRGVKWFAETDISLAENDGLLCLMSESGCAQVLIGLESPELTGLDGIELNSNWKWKNWWRYKQAIRKIQGHGIRVIGCFIVGLDGHDAGTIDRLFDFIDELDLFDVQITVQTAFPGTPLYARLKNEGRLCEESNWRKCTLFDVNFEPTNMTREELSQGFKSLAEQLYSDKLTALRRRKFNDTVRAARRLNS